MSEASWQKPHRRHLCNCIRLCIHPDLIPGKTLWGDQDPHLVKVSWTHTCPHSKRNLDRSSCFAQLTLCTTHRQEDNDTWVVKGHIYALLSDNFAFTLSGHVTRKKAPQKCPNGLLLLPILLSIFVFVFSLFSFLYFSCTFVFFLISCARLNYLTVEF